MLTANQAAETGVLVVGEPELGCLLATGPDRVSWLNGIVSCDVSRVSAGTGGWGLALTKQGKILSDLVIVAAEDTLYVSTAPGLAPELCATFDRMLVMEDAELSDRSADFAWVHLHGPGAVEVASALAPGMANAYGALDWTGKGGAAIVVRRAELDTLIQALVERGGERARAGSHEDWERVRIEHAVPRWGVDFDARDNPHEAALDQRAVSWSKGCYLGQEVVCMQDMRGKLKRRVVALALDSEEPPSTGSEVIADGQAVGEITSATRSELSGRAVALARVRTPHDERGRALLVGGVAATVRG